MKNLAVYAVVVVALGVGAWGVYEFSQPEADGVRLAHLRSLKVPPAGAARFAFLTEEVPDVVSQVTCSCCDNKLTECYAGACPVSCGPCNEQGKIAYDMFARGRSVKEIQAYMAKNHPVSDSVRRAKAARRL